MKNIIIIILTIIIIIETIFSIMIIKQLQLNYNNEKYYNFLSYKTEREIIEKYNEKIEKLNKTIKSKNIKIKKLKNKESNKKYRLTSYWKNDGYGTGSCTGSGLCEKDFEINDKGWYTYKGKLVIATATRYLLNYGWTEKEGIVYHKYYDIIKITIKGKTYDAIVLDSCGACMSNHIIDLFVSKGKYSATTNDFYVND